MVLQTEVLCSTPYGIKGLGRHVDLPGIKSEFWEALKERGYSSSLELTIPCDTRIVMKRHQVN